MKTLFIAAFLFCNVNVFGQDTIYYDSDHVHVKDKSIASFYMILGDTKINNRFLKVRWYYLSGQIESAWVFDSTNVDLENPKAVFWYENGQKKAEINYDGEEFNGQLLTYWENGQLKRNDIYDRGKFVKGNCYTRDGKDTTHYDFDIYPQFPGGDTAMSTFLRINVKYPRKAVRKNIQGKVWVRFIVEKDGRLTDIHVLDGVNKVLDEEALRVVSLMPNWVPSKLDGVAIRRGKTVPINFSLSNN